MNCEDYLKNKLKEIQRKNEASRNKLDSLRLQAQQNREEPKKAPFSCEKVWKKILHNKFVLGFTIRAMESPLLQPRLCLLTEGSILYKAFFYEEHSSRACPGNACNQITCKTSITKNLEEVTNVVAVFDVPNVLDKEVKGTLLWNNQSIVLPAITITPQDYTNHKLQISTSKTNIYDFLALISGQEKFEMILTYSGDATEDLETLLEIHVGLTKVRAENWSSNCRFYLLAWNLSPLFDNSLLEIHRLDQIRAQSYCTVNIYTKSLDSFEKLLLHFHTTASAFCFFKKEDFLLEHFPMNNSKNLTEQLKLAEKFLNCSMAGLEAADVLEFRKKLCDLECGQQKL